MIMSSYFNVQYLHQKMIRIYADIVQNKTLPGVFPNFWRAVLWSQNNAVYICKRIEALQKKIKVCKRKWKYWENINVLFVNKKKRISKKMKYCKKKISFANKNKELQNINETEQKQCFCNTYFPWPYLLIYLQRCFYFAFQSSLSLPYRFPLCASRFCASHFVALFWHGGGVKGWGRVQQAWACLPGSDVIGRDADHNWSRHRPWAEACGWIVSFYSQALKHACFKKV